MDAMPSSRTPAHRTLSSATSRSSARRFGAFLPTPAKPIPTFPGSRSRDRVIHGYFTVDLEIVWEIVEKELMELRRRIVAILEPGP
jgi:hypothetical protein